MNLYLIPPVPYPAFRFLFRNIFPCPAGQFRPAQQNPRHCIRCVAVSLAIAKASICCNAPIRPPLIRNITAMLPHIGIDCLSLSQIRPFLFQYRIQYFICHLIQLAPYQRRDQFFTVTFFNVRLPELLAKVIL